MGGTQPSKITLQLVYLISNIVLQKISNRNLVTAIEVAHKDMDISPPEDFKQITSLHVIFVMKGR